MRARYVLCVLVISLCAGLVVSEEVEKTTCSGKVVDANGNPIAGAKVSLMFLEVHQEIQDFEIELAEELITGKDGKFEFSAVKEEDHRNMQSVVLAEKEGLSLGWTMWMKNRDLETDISLTESATISGRVINEANEPIADANVSLAFMLIPGGDQPRYMVGKAAIELFDTQTDSNGRFVFERIHKDASAEFVVAKPGKANLNTFKPGPGMESELTYPSGANDISFVLVPESKIKGMVVDASTGKGIAGVKVMAQKGQFGGFGQKPVETAEDGSFEINALSAGTYLVKVIPVANKPFDWVAGPAEIQVEAGKTASDVKIVLSKGAMLEVIVTDAKTNQPVKQAHVNVTTQDRQQHFSGQTDTNGVAIIRLMAGEYEIRRAYKEGYQQDHSMRDSIIVENGKTVRHELQLTPAAKLIGIVRNRKRKPVEGVEIRLMPHGHREQRTDAEGKFEIQWGQVWSPRDEETIYYLIARDSEKNLAAAVEVERNAELIEIKLTDGVVAFGKAVDANGQPIAEAKVTVMFRSGNYGNSMTDYQKGGASTDSKGVFDMSAIPYNHKYDFYVSADGYGKVRRQVHTYDVEEGRLDAGTFELSVAELNLSGIVVDDEGKPIKGARLHISGNAQPEINNLLTDEKGRFKAKVCQGDIHLHANYNQPRDGRHMWGNIQTQGGAEDVKIVVSSQGSHRQFVPKEPKSLIGKSLGDMNELAVDLPLADANNRAILFCFFDVQQRPSRHLVKELAWKIEELKAESVFIAIIQAQEIDEAKLAELTKDLNLNTPMGQIETDRETVLFDWGIKGLPWLILTDKDRKVIAEGFRLSELQEKLRLLP